MPADTGGGLTTQQLIEQILGQQNLPGLAGQVLRDRLQSLPPEAFGGLGATSGLQTLGSLGDARVGRADVRTPTMMALEQAMMQSVIPMLQDPRRLLSMFNPAAGAEQSLVSGFFGGGGQPQQPVQQLQFGGPLDLQRPAIVGEAGPEAIVPTGGAPQVVPLQGMLAGPQQPADTGGGLGQLLGALQFTGQPMQTGAPPFTPGAPPQAPNVPGPTDQGGNNPPFKPQFPTNKGGGGGLPQAPGSTQANTNPLAGGGLAGILNQNPGQQVIDALRPVFEQNLQFGLGRLNASVPSAAGSGAILAGNDLVSQALNQFNLTGAQSLQRGIDQQLTGAGLASQRDLAQQQMAMQMLLSMLGFGTPTGFQTLMSG